MHARWQGICLSAVVWLGVMGNCYAQSATPEEEYKKLIKVDETVQPLGEHPFGESVSLYDGTLSFEEIDISLRGNGPTIQFGRSLKTADNAMHFNEQRPFGDWDMDIPRIETLTANQMNVKGWQVFPTPDTHALDRCSYFQAPPDVPPSQPGGDPWSSDQWWYGYHMILPGQGGQELLQRDTIHNQLSPTISGQSFQIVTKQNWMVTCGVTASDGGEGFEALAPDGARYTFAHLVYRPMRSITSPIGTIPMSASSGIHPMAAPFNILYRRDALMYVTRIQDRFGNTLTYNYDGNNLASIVASDGRKLVLGYVSGTPLVHTVTVQSSDGKARIWTYDYDTSDPLLPTLKGVQLPDGSAWSYQLGDLQTARIVTQGGHCQLDTLPKLWPDPVTGSITHPSGLKATFTLTPMLHGRSYVLKQCQGIDGDAALSIYPKYYYQFSLTGEALSGAGLPPETWTYTYSPANMSWASDPCASNHSCPSTIYTDVTDPYGHGVRYTFSNRFDASEGQLQRTDYYSGAVGSTLMRSVINLYAAPTGGPWPASYGGGMLGRTNRWQTEQLAPLQKRTITQDGDNYIWQAEAFNAYAQVTRTKRSNSISNQPFEETATYRNDTNLWVLGLPQTVTNMGTGEVESSNTYNTLDELTSRARFGQELMSYTWDNAGQNAGQLASFTDGNGNVTKLSDYYRGIPRTIDYPPIPGYPNGTHESLAVDDFGQISSITDQAGYTTRYSYDAVGRLTQIDYPNDAGTRHPRKFTYDYVTGAERDIGAGHWRRTMTQGSATETTYFDAKLRPVLKDLSNGSTHATTATGYDWRGLTTFASYPADGSPSRLSQSLATGVRNTYDALGRPTKTQQDSELGTLDATTAYLSGAQKQVTDPKGNITTTAYQVFDEPSYDAAILVQAPAGVIQEIARDAYGNPTKIHQHGSYNGFSGDVIKKLVYDDHHRLCRSIEPESGSEVMDYDAAGNLSWSAAGLDLPDPTTGTEADCARNLVADSAKIKRQYDGMNHVTAVSYPDGLADASFEYGPRGHVRKAITSIATWTYGYDPLGALNTETLDVDGYHWPIQYDHDGNGSVAQVIYPDGKQVAYRPDSLGRPTQVGSYANGILYAPDGNLQYFMSGSGIDYIAQQNKRNLLSDFTWASGDALLVSESFAYDANGNRTAANDLTENGSRDKSYAYDPLNRLVSATANHLWGVETYSYDTLNNLRTMSSDGEVRTYGYDALNHLADIKVGGTVLHSFQYDPQGNVTRKDGVSLVFDKANRLNQVVGTASYDYDASGRRVKKTSASGAKTYYAYGSAGKLLFQMDAAAGTVTDYVYLGDKLLAEVRRGINDPVLNPPATIGFDANPNDGSYTVSWDAVSGGGYELQESTDGGTHWQGAYHGNAVSLAFSDKPGGTYLYRVRACPGECSDWRYSSALGVRPALPTVTVPGGVQESSTTVSWNQPTSATAFDVQVQFNGGAWQTIASDSTGTSIQRDGLVTGSYVYRVSARNAYGSRGWATSAAVQVVNLPAAAPTITAPGISASASYTVGWSALAGVDSYQLQQQYNHGDWTNAYQGSGLNKAISGAINGGTYDYRVRGCNVSGCGPWSATAEVLIKIPPPVPTGVYANDRIVNPKLETLTIVWNASPGATAYDVRDGDTGQIVVHTTALSYGAESGATIPHHGYQVRSCNAVACSAWVNASDRMVYDPPSTPSLSVPANSSGSYTVSWSASNATSYTLQESTNGGGWSTVYSGTAKSHGFSKPTGSYRYQARASGPGGTSAWSGPATVTVSAGPPAPTGVYANDEMVNSKLERLTIVWNASPGATAYDVRNSDTGQIVANHITALSFVAESGFNEPIDHYGYQVRACNAAACSAWVNASDRVVYAAPRSMGATVLVAMGTEVHP